MSFATSIVAATVDQVKATIAGFAELGGLFLDAWQSGDPGEQLYQAFAETVQQYTSLAAQAVRGRILDLATDPGDPDPYNPANESLEPEAGFLSELGENDFFTIRRAKSYASTVATFTNTSATPYTFAPGDVSVARFGFPDITYHNDVDASVYTESGGKYTLVAGASADLQIVADSPGAAFSAGPNEITVMVTGLIGVTCTNDNPATGQDRETAVDYRARCRTQAASVSPNGPQDSYRRLANTNLDGTPLLQSLTAGGDGITPVAITRVYVSQSSMTGIVNVYFADVDGAASAVDVATANENIALFVIAVPDCTTYTGLAAIAHTITVTWAVKYKATLGGVPVTGTAVTAAIQAALVSRFENYDIGGYDQVAGAGTIYLEDVRSTVHHSHPAIYQTAISSPAGNTALAIGEVAVLAYGGGSTVTAG